MYINCHGDYVKDMNTIKEQMKFLQVHESSLNVHDAICMSAHDKKRKKKNKTPTLVTTTSSASTVSSPLSTPTVSSPPSVSTVNSPVGEAAPLLNKMKALLNLMTIIVFD